MSGLASSKRSFITRIARALRARARMGVYTGAHSAYTRTRRHARVAVLTVVGVGLLTGVAINIMRPAQTAAATSNVINFQARLETAAGAIVPDGTYNIEFKLYNVASGGSALWSEDYLNSATQGVTVSNGYVTVNLGSINAFPSTINWDQQLWLTMNIGGSGPSASWDGEMNPRLQLTALPYAFQANSAHQLQQLQGSYAGTLSFGSLTANRSISLPDEGGTLCIQNSVNCGFASATALNGYVQLQTGSPGTQQTGNFNISGNGILGGTLGVTGNTTLGGTATLNTLGAADTSSLLCLNSSKQVAACSSGTGAAFVQGGNSFNAAGTLGTLDNYGLNIQTHGVTAISVDTSQNTTFAGNITVGSVFGVNTASNTVQIGSATANATGANLVLNNYNGVSEPAGVDGAMYYNATLKQFRCYQNGGWVNCAGEGGNGVNTVGALDSQTKSVNGAVISGSNIYLQTADASNPGLVSTAAQTFAGAKTFANDSTTALQVQNAAGTTTVLAVDTQGNNVNLGSNTKLVFGGTANLYQSATGVLATDNSLTIGTNLSVTGTSALTGQLAANGGIATNNAAITTGTGTINGQTISSAASFTGTLAVAGNTTVGGTLGVTGATTLSSTLAVTGTSTFTGQVTANGGLTTNNANITTGTGTVNGAAITSTTFNTAIISGGSLSGGNVSGGSLTATAVNNLNVSGTAISGTGALSLSAGGTNQNLTLQGSGTGSVIVQSASNSTTAFQVQTAGVTPATVLDVDTTNSRVGVGTATPGYTLDIQGGSGIVGQFSGRVIGANAVNTNELTTLGQVNGLITSAAGSYILNQTSLQASSNFHISGTGTADTSLSTPLVTSSGALSVTGGTTLSLQSTSTNAITLDSGTTGAVNVGTGANAKTVTVGNTTGATSLALQSGTGGINLNPSGTSNTGVTVKPGTDSTAAFQIQNAGGTSLFAADTTNSQLIVNSSATLKVQNIDSSGSTATITRTNRVAAASSTSPYGTGSYSPSTTFTPSAGNVLIAYVDVESNNQVMATDGSDITISGGSLTWVPITGKIQRVVGWGIGFRAFYAVVPSTPPANMQVTVDAGSINISKYEVTVDEMSGVNTTTPVAGVVTGGRQSNSTNTWTATLSASPVTADWKILMGAIDQDNTTHAWNTPSGWTENASPASLRASPDATVMYQTGSTTTTLNYTLGSVQYTNADTAYGGFMLKAASGSSINFGTGSAGAINIGNSSSQTTISGATLLQNTSTTAFQVQNAGGTSTVLDVDTTNSRVGIGTATPGYALDVQGGSGIVGQFSGRVIGANAVNTNEFTTLGQVNSLISGSGGSYISNQTTLQTSSNFHISGTGTADTSFSTPLVTSSAALSVTGGTSLTLQSTGANAVSLDSGTTGAVNVGTGANAKAVTIGNTTAGTTVALQGPAVNVNQLTGTNTINLGSAVGSAATQTINIGASSTSGSISNVTLGSTIGTSTTTIQGGTGGIKLTPSGASNTGVLVKPGANSTAAFQVQNTSGYTAFSVDTTNGQAVLGSSSNLNGTLTFANSAGTNTVGLALSGNPNNSYTLLLPTTAPAGGQCIKTGLSNPNQLVFGSCITPTTPQFVQQATNSNASNGSSLATSISTSSAGDLLIAQIGVNTGSAVVTSVTDTAGNTWTKATSGAGGSLDSEIWYAVDAVPTNQVTVNVSGSHRIAVNISEFDGVAQSTVLDVSNGQYDGGGSTHTTPSITTTVDHDLVLASLAWASGPSMTGNGSGWNDMTAVTATPDMSSRFMVGSPAGAFSTSWTSSFYTTSASTIVAFKPAGDGSDYAEDYGTTDPSVTAGDVVALDTSKPAMQAINQYGQVDSKAWIVKASSSNPNDAIGVVSTAPGQVIGKAIFSTGDNPRAVALSGRVPVKVSDENGPIKPGDYLIPSSTPGLAMKALNPGMAIGQALSGFDGPGQGMVTAFVKNTYYPGDTSSSSNNYIQNGSSATLQSLNVTGLTTATDLQATGTITAGTLTTTTTTADSITATNTTTGALSVGGNATVGNLVANGTVTASGLQVDGSAAIGGNVTANGSALFHGSTNSTTAFQVQSSGSTPLFTVDTQNSRVYVGNPTADATGALLVLDNKNTNGDPDGVNGGMYYNAAAGKFRCYQNGSWRDCLSPWVQITKSNDQDVTNSSTYANDNDLQFNVSAGKVYTVRFNVCYAGNSSAGNYKGEFTFPGAIAAKNVSGRYVATGTGDNAVSSAGTLGGTNSFPNNGLSMGTANNFGDKRVFEGDFTFQPNADGTMHYMFAQNTATTSAAARTCANSFIEYQAL